MSNFFVLSDDVMEVTDEDQILFKSATEFSMFITNLANKNKATLTQTVLDYCDDRDIDPESIAKLISKTMKERIAIEMQDAGLLRRESSGELDI